MRSLAVVPSSPLSPVARAGRLLLLATLATVLSACGYNDFQSKDETVKAAWSEVVNQYQRRADLVPNLVNTVKGYAAQEKDVLIGVTEARAKATSIQVTPETLNDPEAFKKFQAAQGELSGALSRLLVVTENYPNLKADANFQKLMDELAGTENRLAVERKRYNEAVQQYNTDVRGIPGVWWARIGGFASQKDYFKAEAGAKAVPKVSFQ